MVSRCSSLGIEWLDSWNSPAWGISRPRILVSLSPVLTFLLAVPKLSSWKETDPRCSSLCSVASGSSWSGKIPNFVIPTLPPAHIAAVESLLTSFAEMLWQNLIFTTWYVYFFPHKWKDCGLDYQNKQDLPFSFLFVLLSLPWPLAARQHLCLYVSMTYI